MPLFQNARHERLSRSGIRYILQKFKVGEVWTNGTEKETQVARHFEETVKERGFMKRIVRAGEILTIGEVKVSTNSMGAEYGRSGGFQVASVLKSGTKDLHGSGYWYHKNEGLDANSWINNYTGVQRPISRSMLSGFTPSNTV